MKNNIKKLTKRIENSKRPVVLIGSGINISNTNNDLLKFVNKYKIPVVSAWTIDAFPNHHAYYFGRQGSIGNRVGNYVVQFSDLLIVLGSRLNIRQTSYNWENFAKKAFKVSVDIDKEEQNKKFVDFNLKINCDLKIFFQELKKVKINNKNKKKDLKWIKWILWCNLIRSILKPKADDYKIYQNRINIYHFIIYLFQILKNNEIIVAADGAATVVPNQVGYLNYGVKYIANSGSASMGFDLPAAIGTAIASPNKKIICLAGDGSIMMNIQELQTIKDLNLNVIIFVINNDGYLSIKQTQKNFFNDEHGASSKSGLKFPDFSKVGNSFGIKSIKLNFQNWKTNLAKIVKKKGPLLVEIQVDLIQQFEPKLKSKKVGNKIVTPSLEDMYPFLDKKIQSMILKRFNDIE